MSSTDYERLRRVLAANLADAQAALNLLLKRDPLRDYVDNIRFNAEKVLAQTPEHIDGCDPAEGLARRTGDVTVLGDVIDSETVEWPEHNDGAE